MQCTLSVLRWFCGYIPACQVAMWSNGKGRGTVVMDDAMTSHKAGKYWLDHQQDNMLE